MPPEYKEKGEVLKSEEWFAFSFWDETVGSSGAGCSLFLGVADRCVLF